MNSSDLTVNNIYLALHELAPFPLQESYDNSGVLVGALNQPVTRGLLCLDITEDVLQEAIEKKCDVIIAHHPVVFQGIKRLNGSTSTERIVMEAIRKQIALVAIHTNLDNMHHGVNQRIAQRLELQHCRILKPMQQELNLLYVYVPAEQLPQVEKAIFNAGAGNLGQYTECGFRIQGTGSFLPEKQANPFAGTPEERWLGEEIKFEVVVPKHRISAVLKAMRASHPYEEIAYGVIPLQQSTHEYGAGMLGELATPMAETDFLRVLKQNMQVSVIRHTRLLNRNIQRVALCGGSGSFLLPEAKAAGADIFITADYKYHQFFDAESQLIIADIGHYESEQFTWEIIYEFLMKKFPTFALQNTTVNTNPVFYS
jgi:dinuclear metal center YbgI/SA1388 family protein